MNKTIRVQSDFRKYTKIFLEINSKHNLISKNDEKYLYEKHIYDSLCIKFFFEKYGIKSGKILDIGCGGGFPCVPIAIEYPEFEITGIDSIRKKISSVEEIREVLNLKNLELICDRVENLKDRTFDLVLSRAVGDLAKILPYGIPLLKKDGYFVAYKSKKAEEEILNAESVLKKYNCTVADTIEYTLPTEDVYERKLICIQRL